MITIKTKSIKRKIELFDGRPDRDTIISEDDISNLIIAMNDKAPKGIAPLDWFLYYT